MIDASAVHTGALDGRNDPDYVMFLLDKKGNIVAFNDDFSGLDPRIVFTVPPAGDHENAEGSEVRDPGDRLLRVPREPDGRSENSEPVDVRAEHDGHAAGRSGGGPLPPGSVRMSSSS